MHFPRRLARHTLGDEAMTSAAADDAEIRDGAAWQAFDIFDFWAEMPSGARIHPRDAAVLQRAEHRFEKDGLPCPFMGPLRTAPVVLLFLSPGFDEGARSHAASDASRTWSREQRSGRQPLPSKEQNEPGWKWWTDTVRQFDIVEDVARYRIAFLNISAYPSASFWDWPMLCALPSCRVMLEWTQGVLFPQAEVGDRTVVCMRSAPYWGLGKDALVGRALFAPSVTRRGHLLNERADDPRAIRKQVIEAVQRAVGGGK